MSAIYHEDLIDVNLGSGSVHRSFLNESIGMGDVLANRFGVRLFRNGEPVNAEDSAVVAFFMAPSGVNYLISETTYPGSTGVSGNTAYVQLPQDCYAVEGQFCLSIKLVGGSITGTMRIVDGMVVNTGATGAVGPTTTVPSSAEIIAAYEDALELESGVVRHDIAQSLTDNAKQQARSNIGAASTAQLYPIMVKVTDNENKIDSELTSSDPFLNEVPYGIYSEQNKWAPTPSGTFSVNIKVSSDDLFKMRASSSVKGVYVFLKSLDGMKTGGTPDYATGYSGYVNVPIGTTASATAPADANWLSLYCGDGYTPAAASLNGYDLLNGVRWNITDIQKRAVKYSGRGVFTAGQNPDLHNLDELYEPNIYYYGVSGIGENTITGYPRRFYRGFSLMVLPYIGSIGGTVQIAVSATTGEMASRVNGGVSWSSWNYSNEIFEHIYDKDVFPQYFDYTNIANGVLDANTGNVITNQYTTGYSVTDYIPVNAGDIVTIAQTSGENLCIGCLYDSNKVFICPVWAGDMGKSTGAFKTWNKEWTFIVGNKNAKYFRYNVAKTSVFRFEDQYVNVIPNSFRLNMAKLLKNEKTFRVGSGLTGYNTFTTIRSAAEYIRDNQIEGATVYVNAGTYDLTVELADVIGEGYDGDRYKYGIQFGGGAHWIFAEGAYLKFNYDGSNVDVANLFSPLVIRSSCTLENLDIEVGNCQYCVHDDWPDRTSNWIVTYKNCRMKHNGNTVGSYTAPVCIGGGLLPEEVVTVDGGRYECPVSFNYPISYHSIWANLPASHPSRIIFSNIWLSGGFRLQDAEWDCNDVDVTITGCSQGAGIGGTHTFFTITEWNNVIRN